MKTIVNTPFCINRFKIFEAIVFEQLKCPRLFNTYIKGESGYAYLLRKWIKEKYTEGITALEVAKMIQQSELYIKSIKTDSPLFMSVQ